MLGVFFRTRIANACINVRLFVLTALHWAEATWPRLRKIGAMGKSYIELVEGRFGKKIRGALESKWLEVRKHCEKPIDATKLEYFLSRKEPEPSAFECTEAAEDEASRMYQLLAKMVLCAPTTWFEVITDMPRPESATDDFKVIGVAFDASSRLRRAGVEYYHHKLLGTRG
eukprot:Skav200534  [mRNA]  locus=scaffold676:18384:23166:+ [translate_table: standard]